MMKNMLKNNKCYITIAIGCLLILGVFLPVTQAISNIDYIKGFDKGPSTLPVVPLKKATFVGFDKESILDDLAYLACVPTSVFNNDGRLFSHPLLFYEDEYKYENDWERTLNARQGLDYFMEDWMSYCNNQLDQMTLVNVPVNKVDQWRADEYVEITGDNLYSIAGEIALQDWSYSDDAVIAVIKEQYENPEIKTKGEISKTLPAYNIDQKQITIDLPDIGTAATWERFEINDYNYKYVTMKLEWPYKVLDYDLQLYDNELGLVDNAMKDYSEHLIEGNNEIAGSFLHNYGEWKISVTAVPKKGSPNDEDQETDDLISDLNLKNLAKVIKNQGEATLNFYPGINVKIPQTPFGCRDADLTLKWGNSNINLGFTVLDSFETEICSSLSKKEIIEGDLEDQGGEATVHLEKLGETGEDENYTICVFSLDDLSKPLDFTIEYSWQQNFSKEEGNGLASAGNGAVLACKLNAPLLYTKPSNLPEVTKDVLYKLGVEKIHLINLGGHLSIDVKNELEAITDVIDYDTPKKIYDAIKKDVEENDVVFTTIDPWTYWYVNERKPAGEYPGALFIGPAAFTAAHHCTPVLIVDLHPRLSQAVVYHTHFWSSPYYQQHVEIPNSGSMTLSSRQVYDFLEDYNLGKLEKGEGKWSSQETIITVAGQYDIGIPWDRSFTGAGLNGRFMFSPVDTAYCIARNIFYSALIFENPGSQKITLWQGSESTTKGIGNRLKDPIGINLWITKQSQEEEFEYPVLQTYADYIHRFNEKASKHWDYIYERADGVTPYIERSPDPIDDGVVPDKSGAYYPDLYETYVIPFYAGKAHYDNVYSSNFEKSVENLNRGVIMWMVCCHGGHVNSGTIALWDPNSPYVNEPNPWRVYETPIVYPGNLREFVRWFYYELLAGSQPSKFTEGFIKYHLLPRIGSTENPDVTSINPQLRLINKFLTTINFPIDFWGALGVNIYRDRILHPLKTISECLPFVNIYNGDGKVIISPKSGGEHLKEWKNGIDFDDAMMNLHSCGINSISCLPAGTYLHLTWTRHGTSYIIMDPWTTTDWSAVWQQMLIKRYAMGDTVGQAYERGMRAVGPEYTIGQSWWDRYQNVELFGDPDLRVIVPGTDYSDANYWTQKETQPLAYDEEININGHTPFGATSYPHEKQPVTVLDEYLWLIIILVLIVIIIIIMVIPRRKK